VAPDTAAVFQSDRYVVLPSLVKDPDLAKMYRYACQVARGGLMHDGDEQVPGTPCAYGDLIMDGLLVTLLPEIERASGLALFPTYSYFRVYKSGDILARHTDRPSCEISVSLCLGFDSGELGLAELDSAEPWPIWIEGPGGTSSVSLSPGDALLYRGIECEHWREPFRGQNQAQVFLHYVDQNGPHAKWQFDKRESTSRLRPVRQA